MARVYRNARIDRIWEGTNEINRLLIPGMILRKAMKGELPLQAEAMKAFESLMTPSFDELDDSLPFAAEKALVENLKTLFLILAGSGVPILDALKIAAEVVDLRSLVPLDTATLLGSVRRTRSIQRQQRQGEQDGDRQDRLEYGFFGALHEVTPVTDRRMIAPAGAGVNDLWQDRANAPFDHWHRWIL